ncbi:MAG: hypothetical protein WAK53_09480, partial [Chromatiaceae bacterium]
ETLASAENHGNPVTYTERTRWVTGSNILRRSKKEKKEMVVLFADATDCSRLLYWGVLKDIVVGDEQTSYTVQRVRKLPGNHKPQDLTLRSTGRTIAPDYIRPYAICYTPGFLEA